MRRLGMACGLVVALTGLVDRAHAQMESERPAMGNAPCLVMDEYNVSRQASMSGLQYQGYAVVENICGRAIQVSFCFLSVGEGEEADRTCFEGSMRPWSRSYIAEATTDGRIHSFDVDWSWRPADQYGDAALMN